MVSPIEKLQQFVDAFTKWVQENVDILYGAEHDNSNKNIVIPASFNATFYSLYNSKLSGVDFSASWWHCGQWNILYSVDVNYTNGNLSYGGFSEVGRYRKSDWDVIDTIPEYGVSPDAAYNILHGYIENNNQAYIVSTESESLPYEIIYSVDDVWNVLKIIFSKNNSAGSVYSKYQGGDGQLPDISPTGTLFSAQYLNVYFYDYNVYSESDGYVNTTTGITEIPSTYNWCKYKDAFLATRMNNDTVINKYISDNNSNHNYTYNYTTGHGDEVTVYYGDNYIIYKADDDAEITYNENYNILKKVSNDLGDDINVPTYNDNKFGPEPPPPPEDDDIDDQVMGAGANLASIARLWLLTRQQLIDLHAAFANAPANYDPLISFIGVLGFGVQPIKVVGDSLPWTLNPINIRMSSGEIWHTGVEGHIVDSQVSAFSFPDIHIQKKYNNFLDYSPYAVHEIFIPMCGWLTLPDIAVDRTISVTYLPDLESMRCRAVVSVVDDEGDKCVIGVKDGIMGAEVPFSNLNHSVWLANLITNAADVTGEIVTGAIGAGFTKTNAKNGTYRPYEGFTIGMAGTLPGAIGNALLSGNVNRTHVVGSNGNRTGFSDGQNIMIKSTYHKIDKPDNYDHTIGKVCNKTGQLTEFNGFTVCDNPHITFSALEAEKEEIKRLLEEGVILPSGE